LSFVFAALTYFWVERPIRFGKWRKSAVAPLCGSLAVLAIVGGVISYANGFPSRISDGLQAIIAGQLIPKPYSYYDWRIETCFIEDSKSDWKFAPQCYGNDKHPLVLLWGSSTAASLYPALVGPLKASGYDLAQFTAIDCGPTLESVIAEDNQRRRPSHTYTKVAPTAFRIFDHQCETTFATHSPWKRPTRGQVANDEKCH
jgi:hypothetical protein